jgi:hypothetical protein
VVVVVYVVVTTVVFVAGAKENCPMVAYGSAASVCTVLATPSALGRAALEAMLHERDERSSTSKLSRDSGIRGRMGVERLVRASWRVRWRAETLVVMFQDLRRRDQSASSEEHETGGKRQRLY